MILVTGGAGFIGSHLIERLLKNSNNRVISLDNYFTGSVDNHINGAKYIKGETKDIENLIKDTPDIIYHLGEYSRVLTSFDDIDLVLRFNVQGTSKVLEFCRKNKVRLVYAGSSTKFGEFDDTEDGKSQTPYSYFKSINTELINNYGRWFGLNYAITYFYNVYGGREIRDGKYATLIGIFTRKYINNEPLTVVAPGTQKRAFTHINDIIDGIVLVGEKGSGDGYCIGVEKEYSILEIAEIFGGKIKILPEKKGDRKSSKINPAKMSELGWVPKQDILNYINEIKSKK
ncbi:MAG: ADP-L-glycero-D-manno-heptose-6-epimerase [Parcubacteria group bacterium CG10_big_fil_rev_8_21_14_0_10_38_31]|nr:MAG: ADP-L-glycero-D-manno-heptose-6-epimerase [Parcubacteria group bacterium CG10_big_fil_rev_8_21_14_0_10_38_31]